ncbi:MAG TPA: hypothetical protein VI168_03395 [Croceibacterium sp.]
MDLELWVAWSQILGVLGGLIALVFVGLQIRDNSRAVRAATAQAVHETYSSWYNSLLDSENALKASTKALTEPQALTPIDGPIAIASFTRKRPFPRHRLRVLIDGASAYS